ncbi:class I SAM-dependent RNA methyltransferase [Alterisphingorhabdus coralli]|uniref:Class I SAM-dependent RNA methyltransferase n=1 Tax=Alterisphingorhabdus coralli TaxID=3071408 RepID=A0AA97F648_9SPHN|nr:class I SAM-dependent RNA methyltransferase [Parasphingorhabdus sp. SCSIO 66989]WOE73972.1 class I SAM-dependent RNA methyltransferase [Parasphingorhabdus sp. SCSIO 66989]
MTEDDRLIVRLAARGDGVTASGQHIPGAAPGDKVREDGGLEHGPHHVTPPCRHYDLCGGCSLQHVDEESYAGFLSDRVASALAAQKLTDIAIAQPHISPPFSRRRTSLRAIRHGRSLNLGFNTAQSHRVVDVVQCDVLHPDLLSLIAALRALLQDWEDPRLNLTIYLNLADQGIDCALKNIDPDSLEKYEKLTDFASQQQLARLVIDRGDGWETLYEPEPVTVSFDGHAVNTPPNSFLQATVQGEAALVEAVRHGLGDAKIIADLFCGIGTFALNLVQGRKVYAAEAGRDAILGLKAAAGRAGLPVFTEHRDLYRRPLSEQEISRFEAVIIDPPRAGAKEQVQMIAQSDLARLVYVSCNPSTFARDAKLLCDAGWVLQQVQPVGQFLWSTHVELVGTFLRSAD